MLCEINGVDCSYGKPTPVKAETDDESREPNEAKAQIDPIEQLLRRKVPSPRVHPEDYENDHKDSHPDHDEHSQSLLALADLPGWELDAKPPAVDLSGHARGEARRLERYNIRPTPMFGACSTYPLEHIATQPKILVETSSFQGSQEDEPTCI